MFSRNLLKKKRFSTGIVYKNSTSSLISGAKSLDEFNYISKEEEKDTFLREQGLTEEEIILKNKLDDGDLIEVKMICLFNSW